MLLRLSRPLAITMVTTKGVDKMKESMLAGLLLTAAMFGAAYLRAAEEPPAAAVVKEELSVEEKAPVPQEKTLTDDDVTVRVLQDGAVEEMTVAEFLPGVVRGEMLPAFESEALKAQAVAERTFLCYQLGVGKPAHPQADICTDPGCCSAYLSAEAARRSWGAKFDELNEKICAAVAATDGVVALYDGQPILAVFHSSSDATTAASGDVWTADLPYLRSVTTPESSHSVPNYYSVKTLSREDFRATFAAAYPEADFSGTWVTGRTENDSGRVETITIGGVTVSGNAVRSLYGLRSSSFTVSVGEEVTFSVTGYGHGVGMSQYGANELARQGRTYEEILRHYYTDITLGGYTKG